MLFPARVGTWIFYVHGAKSDAWRHARVGRWAIFRGAACCALFLFGIKPQLWRGVCGEEGIFSEMGAWCVWWV